MTAARLQQSLTDHRPLGDDTKTDNSLCRVVCRCTESLQIMSSVLEIGSRHIIPFELYAANDKKD